MFRLVIFLLLIFISPTVARPCVQYDIHFLKYVGICFMPRMRSAFVNDALGVPKNVRMYIVCTQF